MRLAITPGEPAGIGPELLVGLAQQRRGSQWIAIADIGSESTLAGEVTDVESPGESAPPAVGRVGSAIGLERYPRADGDAAGPRGSRGSLREENLPRAH